MNNSGIIKILNIVFGVLDIIALIAVIIVLVSSSKIKTLQLTADFSDLEIDVNNEYTFTVTATPSKASTKKLECVCDDPDITFKITKEGKAVLKTGANETTITVYVKDKKVKSNELRFNVVDLAQRARIEAEAEAARAAAEAEAAAAAEAAAQAEAEAAMVKEYVKVTGDSVNVRGSASTDGDKLGKAKKGEKFEKVEDVDDWTHLIYNGQDGYIKSEYLETITEEEYNNSAAAEPEKKEEKQEEKKEETQNNTASAEEAAKKAAEEAAKKAAEEAAAAAAQAQADALAAQQAAAAAAAAGPVLECADGPHTFTAAQYNFLKGFWYRDGQTSPDDWKVYAHKHTYAECIQICQIEGGL